MIEVVNGTVIGEQYVYRVQFWTKLKRPLEGMSHRIGREWYYFNDLVKAEDWFKENAEQLKKSDTAPELWAEIEIRSWEL